MGINMITDQFMADITLTRARYEELVCCEDELCCLKFLIRKKAEEYSGLSISEIAMLNTLFCDGARLATDENAD